MGGIRDVLGAQDELGELEEVLRQTISLARVDKLSGFHNNNNNGSLA